MSIRRFFGISLLALVAGCNQTDNSANLGMTGDNAAATTQQAAVDQQPAIIQGTCPQVYLMEGTAVFRKFARGVKDDPSKLQYQATLADTTRRCVMNESQLRITVMAQGRIVTGPEGSAGSITLPIRVAATDGKTTLYSELVQFQAQIPADGGAGQFIFTHPDVTLPGGAGNFTKIYLGFDEGPYNTK
jgi:hypothetical protein